MFKLENKISLGQDMSIFDNAELCCQSFIFKVSKSRLNKETDCFGDDVADRIYMNLADPQAVQVFVEFMETDEVKPSVDEWSGSFYFKVIKMISDYCLGRFYNSQLRQHLHKFRDDRTTKKLLNLAFRCRFGGIFVQDFFGIIKRDFRSYENQIVCYTPLREFLFCLERMQFMANEEIILILRGCLMKRPEDHLWVWKQFIDRINLRKMNFKIQGKLIYQFRNDRRDLVMWKILHNKLLLDQMNLYVCLGSTLSIYTLKIFGDITLRKSENLEKKYTLLKTFYYKSVTYVIAEIKIQESLKKIVLLWRRNRTGWGSRCIVDGIHDCLVSVVGFLIFVVAPWTDLKKKFRVGVSTIYHFNVKKMKLVNWEVSTNCYPTSVLVCRKFLYFLHYKPQEKKEFGSILRYDLATGSMEEIGTTGLEQNKKTWLSAVCVLDILVILGIDEGQTQNLVYYADPIINSDWWRYEIPVPWNSLDFVIDFYDEAVRIGNECPDPHLYIHFLCDGKKTIYSFNCVEGTFTNHRIHFDDLGIVNRQNLTLFSNDF